MNDSEKLQRVKAMTSETDENILLTYLEIAGERVLCKAYPFNHDKKAVPDRYANVQIEAAVYLLNKRGAEGQTYHSENGINRTYEAASIPDSILKSVTPYVGVI